MNEDKITLVVEEFNTRLLKLINQALLESWNKAYAKSKVIELCEECNKQLTDLEAPELLINQTIESIKLQFMRSWIMVVREFMTDEGLRTTGASQRYVDYVSQVNEALCDINEKLANGTLSTIGADGRRISVRNLAEINSRYELITKDIERVTADGNKFVIASAHADASERCSYWQGKIYLVDLDINSRPMGQYPGHAPQQTILGYIDGRPYYSLLEACENGFLSFNCQHRLIKYYKGVHEPRYDMLRVRFQRSLTARQRELENRIRMYKRREQLSVKGARVKRKNPYTGETVEMSEYKYNQMMSTYWQEEYSRFSEKNGLPEYRWRLRITEYE